jgi:hypothetical protein
MDVARVSQPCRWGRVVRSWNEIRKSESTKQPTPITTETKWPLPSHSGTLDLRLSRLAQACRCLLWPGLFFALYSLLTASYPCIPELPHSDQALPPPLSLTSAARMPYRLLLPQFPRSGYPSRALSLLTSFCTSTRWL